MDNWYALFVGSGQEEKTKKILENIFEDKIKIIIPQRELRERKDGKWSIVSRKLFPGYLLMKGNIDVETYYNIKKSPIIGSFLRDEGGLLTIEERELRALKILVGNDDGTIEISQAYRENEKIKIIEGPLVGLEGHIESIDTRKGRAKVKVDFLGQTRIVQLGIDFVDKI